MSERNDAVRHQLFPLYNEIPRILVMLKSWLWFNLWVAGIHILAWVVYGMSAWTGRFAWSQRRRIYCERKITRTVESKTRYQWPGNATENADAATAEMISWSSIRLVCPTSASVINHHDGLPCCTDLNGITSIDMSLFHALTSSDCSM